jgi:hypothetical protein
MSIPPCSTYIGLDANAIHNYADRLHGAPKAPIQMTDLGGDNVSGFVVRGNCRRPRAGSGRCSVRSGWFFI